MKTIKGIYLNLQESEYCFNFKGLSFYFSSKIYMTKFANSVMRYVDEETAKLKLKYGMNLSFEIYLMLSYYKKIEKRGFRVYDNENKREITRNSIIVANII